MPAHLSHGRAGVVPQSVQGNTQLVNLPPDQPGGLKGFSFLVSPDCVLFRNEIPFVPVYSGVASRMQ